MKCYLFIGPFNIHGFFNKKNLKKFKIINGMLKWLVQRQDVDKSCVSVWMDVTCGYILSLNAIFILCHFIMETFLHIDIHIVYIYMNIYILFLNDSFVLMWLIKKFWLNNCTISSN